jgi:uncharacterized membrane protein YsdA (DUF1294 family)/cold shock CspA family protein
MRKQGSVIRWDDARGFGFIRSATSTSDVYFHVRDFRGAALERPRHGLAVTFEEIHIGGKGPRAMAVQAAGSPTSATGAAARPASNRRPGRQREHSHKGSGAAIGVPLMIAYFASVGWGVWVHRLPWWALVASLLLNAATFFAYMQDKYAATQRAWRIKEDTLHLWSLVGGWWGAWLAQQAIRHKSNKRSFQSTYWVTVVAHCGAVAAWLWWLAPMWRVSW